MSHQIMNIRSSNTNIESYPLMKTKSGKPNRSKSVVAKALAVALTSVLSLASLSSYAADYSRAEKELRIMSKIFDTSLSEAKQTSNRRQFPGSRKTEAVYLAKQGMVFSFSFSQSGFSGEDWQAFGEGIGQLVGSISAEIAQSFGDVDFVAPIAPIAPRADGNWEVNMEAYEDYQEVMENLRDEQRDKREEVRDIQRSIRDIERQARREEVDSQELEKTKKKLEEKMKVLSKKMEQYDNVRKEYEEKRKEKYRVNNQTKSDLITSTLCDYGATLRSLKSNEHITLIFKKFENDKDQVHVFNYSDVKNCSDKDKLLKKAVSYQL